MFASPLCLHVYIMLYRSCTARVPDTFSLILLNIHEIKCIPIIQFCQYQKLSFERLRRKLFLIDIEGLGGRQILYACTSSKLLEYIWGIYCSRC